MIKYFYFTVLIILMISCSTMDYKPLSKEEIAQSNLKFDGFYFCYQRKPEKDSSNTSKRHHPEFDPAHLSIYLFSKEGKAIYRGIMAEMWQIPGSSNDDSWIFNVLLGRLGWTKRHLSQEYKKTDSYSLKGNNFILTSYNRKKIFRYTRECKILDNSDIVIDQDTFKFKKYYANYHTFLENK